MTEFWNESLTKASWRSLQDFSKRYDFILIGGWAVYLWTDNQKSKDIDIVIDFDTLGRLRQNYDVSKNDRLKKYEIQQDKFDVDIYVKYYSELGFPLEELEVTEIEGFTVPVLEDLVILKQNAEIDRKGSVKGKKDAVDILSMLIYCDFDMDKYKERLEEHGLDLEQDLVRVVKKFDADESKYLNMGFKEFKDWQNEFLGDLGVQ
ncbi:MAG: DUF6036 family nucleotidyltransferase [Candidatus Thermoplasmatota archaeon]